MNFLRDHLLGLLPVLTATVVAVLLSGWLTPGELVLIYVIAVMGAGLRFGSGVAISAAIAAFFLFNFFHTEPHFTLRVENRDQMATLVFLCIIALISGQAASLIRRRFLRLKTESERLRSALLSSVSHDLKSPLSAMIGAAESLLLLEEQLSSHDRRELARTLYQESRRLEGYIQNLLDMTRLAYGDPKIEREWVFAADLLSAAVSRIKRYRPDALIELGIPVDSPPLFVHGGLIEQAIFNILENAVKFSPPDKPVSVSAEWMGGVCRIVIEDNGPGIPKEHQSRIFDMFYIVSGGDRPKSGTGMGLAISRDFIVANGGTIELEERKTGQGSRFVVTLPIAKEKEA